MTDEITNSKYSCYMKNILGINNWQRNKFNFMVALFIFSYPLFGATLRHWYSGFTVLIVFFGIYYLFSNFSLFSKWYNLTKNEIILCFSVSMLFLTYLISGFVNGWNDNQLEFFAGEFNFLLFIPLFVVVRNIEDSVELIIKGTILSGILVFPYLLYDLFVLNFGRVEGVYGHLFIGPVSVFTAVLSMSSYKYFKDEVTWVILITLSTMSSMLVIAYSKSGTAYILAVFLFLLVPFIIIKNRMYKVIFIVLMLLFMSVIFLNNDKVRAGTDRVISSYYLYKSLDSSYEGDFGTLGNRIELWKLGLNIFKENVFFGVGRNNFKLYVSEMHKDGQVNQSIYDYSKHPHNIYVESLVSKGLFGFVVLMFIFYLLFKKYIEAKRKDVRFCDVAVIHLAFIIVAGVATEAPLLKNNFISIFLLYSAVFYSFNSRELLRIKNNLNATKIV